jgi:hypothetical protein
MLNPPEPAGEKAYSIRFSHPQKDPLVEVSLSRPTGDQFCPLLGVGVVEAGGEVGGVGVVELHEAVGVGQDGAEVQPVEEINAGFDVEALAGGALGFQQDCAVWPALQVTGEYLMRTISVPPAVVVS